MKNKSVFICVHLWAFFFVLIFQINAQSLERVRELALANSRELAKYNLAIESAKLDEKAWALSYAPSVSIGANAGINLWEKNFQKKNPLDTFTADANLTVKEVLLFAGGKNIVLKSINALTTEMARKDARAAYFSVLASADSAYFAALQAKAEMESGEAALETAQLSLDIAQVRHDAGIINPADYLQAQAEKESKEASRNQARRNLTLALTKLRTLTGQTITLDEEFNLDDYEGAVQSLAAISDDALDALYGNLWDIAAKNNPSLAKSALSKEKAAKNLSVQKRAYSPTISGTFGTSLDWELNEGFWVGPGHVGLSLSIPLDLWNTANSVAKSKLAQQSAALDYLNAESSLETELESAVLEAAAAAGTIVSARRSMEYARQHFDYVLQLYKLSQKSVADMSDAQVLLNSSRSQLIRANFAFLNAVSSLRSLGAFEDEAALVKMLE
jgi:outer membrane protein TolC